MSFFLLFLSSKEDPIDWGYLLSFFINDLNPFNKVQKVKRSTFITCEDNLFRVQVSHLENDQVA